MKLVPNHRDPLTTRIARTVADSRSDPYAWWEGPQEPSHIVGAAGAMRKLTVRDLDRAQERRTMQVRERYDSAFGACKPVPAPIALDGSVVGRLVRWVRGLFGVPA